LSVCILSERKISFPGFGVMSENELQARGQGFFWQSRGCAGAHGAVESAGHGGQQAAPLLEFFKMRFYVCFFRMKYPKNLSGPLRRL